MKTRLSCLLLSLIMIIFCFAGCAEKDRTAVMEKIGEEASAGAVTLRMYLMSEAPVSAEQELAMENAVNAITEKEFKVRMDLKYFTADQYYEKLEADLAKMKQYYDNGGGASKVEKNTDENATSLYVDENGLPVTYYPPIEDFDVDIFYFGGYDKYVAYRDAGYLKDITEDVNGSAKALQATINTKLLSQVKTLNGKYDVIPVNRPIGEYTYLLLNKNVLNETKYAASDITSLVDENCRDLLAMTKEIFGDEYVPLKSFSEDIDLVDVKYFGIGSNGMLNDNFSLIAGSYNSEWKYGALGSYPEMSDIFNTADSGRMNAVDQLKVLKEYELLGYYGSEDDADKSFAVGYIKGGVDVIEKYGDEYEIVPIAMPTLKTDDVYEHLFAVSDKTNSELKSSEIINYLNTNEQFRNLILYGIEGKNYEWVDAIGEDGNPIVDDNGKIYKVVRRITDKPELNYVMSAEKTGNTVLAYPAEGENPLTSKYTLKQNEDIVLEYTLGFNLYNTSVDLTSLKTVSEASAEFYSRIKAAKTAEELNTVLSEIEAYVGGDEVKSVLGTNLAEGEEDKSVAAYYEKWLVSKGLKQAS